MTAPRRLVPFVALLAALLLAAAAIALAVARPAPARIAVGSPGDGYFLANFYRGESGPGGTFRWSAPGARLLLPAAADGPLALELRLAPPPFAPPEAPLRITRDGATLAVVVPQVGPRRYRLLLPPDAVPEPPAIRLEPLGLAATPAFGPGDPRPLGVALSALELGTLPAEGLPPGALMRGALVALGLLLAWAVLVVAGVLPPRLDLGALLIAIAGVGLALWAWRDPLGFAWAVPNPTMGLVAGALGLALACRYGPWLILLAAARPRVTLLVGLAAGWALLLAPTPLAPLGALVLTLLPGLLTAWALFPPDDDPALAALLGTCGAIAVAALLLLALHALPGPLPGPLVSATFTILALLVGLSAPARPIAPSGLRALRGLRGSPARPAPSALSGLGGLCGSTSTRLLTLALLIAAVLRLWHLGSAEFQGDEARAMLLAAAAVQGDDGALLTHTKGPVEALLPLAPLATTGVAPEWAARLPFALASLAVLAGVLALLRSFGTRPSLAGAAALSAVALLAVDGFAIGFGRIVQYQSVVMLMMAGSFWCCWRFYGGAAHPLRHLLAAAALLAVGILAHYDAAMVAPALAWLVIAGGLRRGWRPREWLGGLLLPVALGTLLLASFFGPYVLGPAFATTAEYLAGRAAQGDAGGPPFNNLPLYADILAFYNAPPLVPAIAAVVLLAVAALLLRHSRPRLLGACLALGLGVAALVQWLAPELFRLPGGGSWAGLAFGLPLLGLGLAPGVPGHVRATALWFATALCANAFLIAEPRTHFYAAHVPAALLVALAIAGPSVAPVRNNGSPTAGGVLAPRLATAAALALLAAGGLYAQLVFLRQFPEYQRSFPAARPAWLLARYGDTLPEAGYFGFPHRDGWKAAAELFRRGELQGSYATNQNRWLAGWYTRDAAPQCTGQPDLFLIAEGEATVAYPPGYALVVEIYVGPARAMAIYGREPNPDGPRAYQLEELAAAFDTRPLTPFPALALLNERPPPCR